MERGPGPGRVCKVTECIWHGDSESGYWPQADNSERGDGICEPYTLIMHTLPPIALPYRVADSARESFTREWAARCDLRA